MAWNDIQCMYVCVVCYVGHVCMYAGMYSFVYVLHVM